MEKKKKIYISGPISGLDLNVAMENFKNAKIKAIEVTGNDYEPVSTFDYTTDFQQEWKDYMKEDIKKLCDCDAIFMMKGWENSRGANMEYFIATQLELERFYQQPTS